MIYVDIYDPYIYISIHVHLRVCVCAYIDLTSMHRQCMGRWLFDSAGGMLRGDSLCFVG